MSTRRRMVDATTRHQVFLQRYAGSQTKQLLAFVKNLTIRAQQLLDASGTELNKARYTKLIAAYKDYIQALTSATMGDIKSNLEELVKYEAAFTDRLVNQAANNTKVGFETVVPTTAQLNAAAFTTIMDQKFGPGIEGGLTVGGALSKYGARVAGAIVHSIRQGYANGTPTHKIAQDIEDLASQKITRSQASAVGRTVTNYVANSAKESFYAENDDLITGYQVVATLDDRTTLTCFLAETPVINLGALENVFRSQYAGEIITITTASGKKISGTPNHPILTPEGFLPLGKLNPGEHVVYTCTDETLKIIADQDISMHTNIGQLFDSLSKSSSFNIFRKSPTKADFYGDGEFFKGEIDIISTKGKLWSDFQPMLYKQVIDVFLTCIKYGINLFCSGPLFQHFLSRFPVTQPSCGDASEFKNAVQSVLTDSQVSYDFTRPDTLAIHGECKLCSSMSSTSGHIINYACSLEQACNSSNTGVIFNGQSASTGSLSVFADDIVSVSSEFKACHVYSLSSNLGLYTANGIVVKNCGALDGQVFDKDDFEYPPYHWNCRSTYIGVIDPKYSTSSPDAVRPSKGSDGTEEVSAGTNYNAWLKTQSEEFQNEVLGKERADMFRAGASVQSFVDENYQPYTVDELKAKDDEHI